MELFALMVIALLVAFLALVVHAWCGNGTPVAGVPRLLWVFGLITFDPLIVLSYLAFAVLGLAKQAAWRRWVVYGAMALFLLFRLAPLSVPASGVYPKDSAEPVGLLPSLGITLASSFGDASTSTTTFRAAGNGWAVRRAVVVADGHPVSARLVQQVAEVLHAAGVPEVRFVQSDDALPAPAGELLAAVSVHNVSDVDLGAVAYWSGDVRLSLGRRPFAQEELVGPPDPLLELGSGGFEARWSLGATRFGCASGAARYNFVLDQVGDVRGKLTDLLSDPDLGGVVAAPGDAGFGASAAPSLDGLFAPMQLQPIVAGAARFADEVARYRLQLGADPEAELRGLAERLAAAGWEGVELREGGDHLGARWWRLAASQRADGERRSLRVGPSKAGVLDLGANGTSASRFDSVEDPRSELPMGRDYIVSFEQLLDEARLEALALRLLESDGDGDGDDYVLRTLGKRVPAERYDDWRSRVLAGDCSVANLLCVAQQDRHRGGREAASAALVDVAAWTTHSSGVGAGYPGAADARRELLERVAEQLEVSVSDDLRPPVSLLERAGVPMLDEQWRPITSLQTEVAADPRRTLGYSARLFVADDGEGWPVRLTLEQVQDASGERWLCVASYCGAEGRGWSNNRRSKPAELLDEGVVTFNLTFVGGWFEVRRVGGQYAVRWRSAA